MRKPRRVSAHIRPGPNEYSVSGMIGEPMMVPSAAKDKAEGVLRAVNRMAIERALGVSLCPRCHRPTVDVEGKCCVECRSEGRA